VTFTETLSNGRGKAWKIHMGGSFADVGSAYWAAPFVERVYHFGITAGCSAVPLNYCPGNSITRAEMAVMLIVGRHGKTYAPPAATGTVFSDVPAGHWAASWIEELLVEGITSGCGSGQFCPGNPITRAEMAVMLLVTKHGAGYQPPAASGTRFADIPASHWAAAWIEQLAAEGITAGCSPTNFCPDNPVTRAEMAVFLSTIFQLELVS
jgi:hypothetical protein